MSADSYQPRRAAQEPAPAHDGSPPIELRNLTKHFGKVVAVDDVTLTIPPGVVTGFLGPNGAGKTTTLSMLAGLVTPTSGTATFGGRSYAELDSPQQTVGVALDAAFHPGRSGRDHLRVLAPTAHADNARVDELLDLVKLTEAARRTVGGYSLGMRQRLALATALLGDPDYLILDEPANGLDPEGIRWLRSFLRGLADEGKTVLVSSHMLSEVNQTADEVAVIGHGHLLRHGPIDQLGDAEPTSLLRVGRRDRDAARAALTEAGWTVLDAEDASGPYLRVATEDTAAIGRAMLQHQVAVVELAVERVDLEATFFQMLEQEAS
ncbi:ABC transporter ATP-binding protein [Microlunatus sp. Y2014]|uniref:ABC transporter ATP-binding protein n=1 Tax=Microlunatus sp. Y2014 TaxID=3418488 RepID=UPI003DA778FE